MKRLCTKTRNISALADECFEEEQKLGTETEAEKHMKALLQKQLDTKITLKDQFSKHRTFTTPCTYTPLTELLQGTCSLESYRSLENKEEKFQELQRCGLSKDEINFYFAHKSNERSKTGGISANPEIEKQRLEQINDKIKAHQKDLEKREAFAGAKELSRHEMEIEKSLYAGCDSKKQLNALIKENSDSGIKFNDPFAHVKCISDELMQRIQKRRREKRKKKNVEISDDESPVIYDPNIHHVIVPLDEDEISKNKLSLEDIRKLPRFENYEPGEPNKVLYLKNLHHKVTVRDLQAIFGIFEVDSSDCIGYKLLTGKMKGQAFVTFPDTETAKRGLIYANGYLLRSRPIIIEYGKKR